MPDPTPAPLAAEMDEVADALALCAVASAISGYEWGHGSRAIERAQREHNTAIRALVVKAVALTLEQAASRIDGDPHAVPTHMKGAAIAATIRGIDPASLAACLMGEVPDA